MEICRIRITENIILEAVVSGRRILRTDLKRGTFEESCPGWFKDLFRDYLEKRGDPEVDLSMTSLNELPDKIQRVYIVLREIAPFGSVVTYSDLAKATGTHPRFVGYAMRMNPLPLIVPCHRVVGKRGLGGFSSGVDIKEALLRFEGCLPALQRGRRTSSGRFRRP